MSGQEPLFIYFIKDAKSCQLIYVCVHTATEGIAGCDLPKMWLILRKCYFEKA